MLTCTRHCTTVQDAYRKALRLLALNERHYRVDSNHALKILAKHDRIELQRLFVIYRVAYAMKEMA